MTFESPAVRRVAQGPSRGLRFVAWTCWAAAVLIPACVLVADGRGSDVELAIVVGLGCLILGAALLVAHRGRPVAGKLHGGVSSRVTVGESTLTIDAMGLTLAPSDVIDGWREEHGALHQVILQRTVGDQLAIRVPSAATAETVLDAVSVGVRQRAVTLCVGGVQNRLLRALIAIFSVVGAVFAVPLTLGAIICLFVGSFRELAWMMVMTLPAWVVFLGGARMLGLRTIKIGRDGVTSKLDLTPARFVPYRGMKLDRDGRSIALRSAALHARIRTGGVQEAIAIAARIEEARVAYHERAALRADLLARHGKPLDAWREQLRQLVAHDSYRSGLGPSDLVAIVEDPSIPPDERVAAATALSTLPHRDRTRLRAVVETTVEPKLRVALERALDGVIDEDALDAAQRRH